MFTELIQGDCMVEMDKLISKGIKFDAIITDPPQREQRSVDKWQTG